MRYDLDELQYKEAQRIVAKLDLDARRAEANQEPHEVTLAGRTYLFLAEMPVEVMTALKAGELEEATKLLMVDRAEWGELSKAVPTDKDLMAVIELYGLDQGESSASAASSNGDGTKSRPTSDGTTSSTSGKSASGRKR